MDPECATEAVVSRSAQRLAHYHPCRARDGHARGVSVPQPLQWRSWRQQPLRLLRSCRHDAATSQHPPASEPHVSDCMRRARSTAGSSRDARSPLCATGVNEPVVTTVPCCWTLELTAAASTACGPGLILPICKCAVHFRRSQVPRESRFCQTSHVPCRGPLSRGTAV